MTKLEVQFRRLFKKAATGDLKAAKTILNMAKRHFGPEDEDDVERIPHLMTKKMYEAWSKKHRRIQAARPVSPRLLFRTIAEERVTIEIEGRKVRRTIFEAIMRRISTMALKKDVAASELLEVARRLFPSSQKRVEDIVYIGTEEDMKLYSTRGANVSSNALSFPNTPMKYGTGTFRRRVPERSMPTASMALTSRTLAIGSIPISS
jgi:hypothetical protein